MNIKQIVRSRKCIACKNSCRAFFCFCWQYIEADVIAGAGEGVARDREINEVNEILSTGEKLTSSSSIAAIRISNFQRSVKSGFAAEASFPSRYTVNDIAFPRGMRRWQ